MMPALLTSYVDAAEFAVDGGEQLGDLAGVGAVRRVRPARGGHGLSTCAATSYAADSFETKLMATS